VRWNPHISRTGQRWSNARKPATTTQGAAIERVVLESPFRDHGRKLYAERASSPRVDPSQAPRRGLAF
jgi:hypothetical protein